MACSNCYNGCVDIVSDKCVRYSGVDVPVLGILNGDSLSYVEQSLITFLTSTLDGSGIKIEIDEDDYCTLVSQYLQSCSTVTALDLFKALVKAACNLQTQVDAVEADVATIEANYTVSCLSGVSAGDGTHAIVQAIITKLCSIDVSLTSLATDVANNYVKIADINSYIAAYLASTATVNRYYNRMVPYSIVMYNGSLSYFDATGAGLPNTDWEKIYLCNGLNGTPDLRGRVPVGAINSVPGPVLPSQTNPASSTFNPSYTAGVPDGNNSTTLTLPQIPIHNHTVTDIGHTHLTFKLETVSGDIPLNLSSQYAATRRTGSGIGDSEYEMNHSTIAGEPNVGKTNSQTTGVSINNSGGGEAHSNVQPVMPVHFIMYIP